MYHDEYGNDYEEEASLGRRQARLWSALNIITMMTMMIVTMITVTMFHCRKHVLRQTGIWHGGEDWGPFEPLFSEHTMVCFTTVQIITLIRIGNSQGKSADHQRGFHITLSNS